MVSQGQLLHRNRLCFPCLPAGRFAPFFAQAKKGEYELHQGKKERKAQAKKVSGTGKQKKG